ncbi:MAG TPA: LysM peptidoglycan-binding domain-containing protein [Planctomycetota bacterium]|nr:LysM peptidoglycan-binding domain-containing protein [Planctomycetota bacterium]
MKRDARIGLAVVLVLGLGVTLLVGKAIYKHGGNANDLEGEVADNDTGARNPMNISAPRDPNGVTDPDQTATPPNTPVPPGSLPGDGVINCPIIEGGRETNPPPPPMEYYSYIVTSNDSPWSIAFKIYGDGKYTQKIMDANGLKSSKLKAGTVLKIPAVETKPLIALQPYHEKHETGSTHQVLLQTKENTPGGKTATTYKIENGDTLDQIAKKHYGISGPKTIQLIVAANHGLNPGKLKVGQEITLPAIK